ncbi:hypothetical protein C9J03_16315 [Photobacterium gaetbulicola]|uniref:Uncharacterized protein n=1 Tax=Photobacterium gaetbulicola Gung47 TaxID=658445 RepID=A0A0C5WQL5_9GAMM|nr:hypothetical protein [Photobacterium gaetbulicola]AJR05220.1 hypothetical protein H744_1c0194 [Photobacterium gaetbulicola Gung47]PSU06052.1 hypothetical protein C9J03_16315 [Photobacterium gaetbulicola]
MMITVTNNYKKLFSVGLLAASMAGCGGGSGGSSDGKPGTLPPEADWPSPDISISAWSFNGGSGQSVASAKVAGSYAVADPAGLNIEIRDIHQTLKHRIDAADIVDLLPDMNLNHDNALCGMTFTPSGRFLYLAVCDRDAGRSDDAILAYNTNTEALTVFHRLTLQKQGASQLPRVGMNYFSSTLYVGGDSAVYRIDADRNAAFEVEHNGRQLGVEKIALAGPVQDIALDMEVGNLYLQTPDSVYKLPHHSQSVQRIYRQDNLTGIAFSRVFGSEGDAGLYISVEHGERTGMLFSPLETVRSSGQIAPTPYLLTEQRWHDFSLTADGKLLFADNGAHLLRDNTDLRLDFDAWMRDELAQYVAAIKGLTASGMSGNYASPEGFLHRKLEHTNPNTSPIADNVGWALYLLMVADQIEHDPEIEQYIELLIKRHAGLHEDGKGGVKSVDGHFVRNYNTDGSINAGNPQYQVYISMKFLPAAIKAAEMYPDNQNIASYAKYLQQVFQRAGDVVRAEQRITWDSDDFGPVRLNRLMSNETWLYGDIAAAQDPLATRNYGKFTYERENFLYDYELLDQPVIKSSHSAFIIMGGPLILDHHFHGKSWAEQNNNYYALTQSETDEMGFTYFAGFSAGHSPNSNGNYYNDGPTDHPDDFIHFPAVSGFGQLGKTDAVVGAYMAYRDGRRQTMVSAGDTDAQLLMRWSANMPDYDKMSVGIADFWYGAIGLAETIQPGVVQPFRNTFYRPEVQIGFNEQNRQQVLYSTMTPRLVTGIRADGSEEAFGYHLSPFVVPTGEIFAEFRVEDPQGDWVELDDIVGIHNITAPLSGREVIFKNPNFELGANVGWETVAGNVTSGGSIHGSGVTLQDDAILTQAVHLPYGMEGSEYRISTLIEPQGQAGRAKLRLSWSSTGNFADIDPDSQVESSNVFGNWANKVMSLDIKQPANAKYLHIEYLTEGSGSFVFGNTALQSFGAKQPFSNGDFEQGSSNWNLSNRVYITDDSSEVIQGSHSLKFDLSGGVTNWQSAERRIDISDDPAGTRYLVRFKVGQRDLAEAKFEIKFDIENPQRPPNSEATPTGDWRDVGFVDNDSPEEITVTARKRPGETALNLVLRMKQDGRNAGRSTVVLDDVRVYHQQILDDSYCNNSAQCY